jgi:hypothetical protein
MTITSVYTFKFKVSGITDEERYKIQQRIEEVLFNELKISEEESHIEWDSDIKDNV